MANAIESEILATLLRINERLEALEGLLRAQLEHSLQLEARRRRELAAVSMIAGNDARHDD